MHSERLKELGQMRSAALRALPLDERRERTSRAREARTRNAQRRRHEQCADVLRAAGWHVEPPRIEEDEAP